MHVGAHKKLLWPTYIYTIPIAMLADGYSSIGIVIWSMHFVKIGVVCFSETIDSEEI